MPKAFADERNAEIAREASARPPKRNRLAVTVPSPIDGSYPAPGVLPNTYYIVFVDASFLKIQGFTPQALAPRQDLTRARELAHNTLDGAAAYVPVYTLLEVTFYDSRWWFTYSGGGTPSSGSSGSSGDSGSGVDSGSGDSGSGSGDSGSGSGDSGSGDSGSGSSGCVTWQMLGLPPPPGDGKYLPMIENGCFTWLKVGPCTTASGSSSGA